MQKLLLKLSFLLLPIFALIISVNYFIDPGGSYYKKDFYKKVASAIFNEKNILLTENLHNFLGSEFVISLIENQKKKSDIITIGSSRVMPITSKLVGDKNFMNYGIHAAKLGDIVAMYQLLYENNNLPNKLIIGIGPSQLMQSPHPKKPAFNKAYLRFLNKFSQNTPAKDIQSNDWGEFKKSFDYYSELLSPKYFQQSIKFFKAQGFKDKTFDYEVVDVITDDTQKIIPYDNSRFKHIDKNKDPNQKIFESKSKTREGLLSTFKDIDRNSSILLQRLILDALKNKVQVIVFIQPFDPYYYAQELKDNAKNNILDKVDNHIYMMRRQFKNQFYIIGSTNPFKLGIDYKDAPLYYFDYSHLTSDGMKGLFKRMNYFNNKNN